MYIAYIEKLILKLKSDISIAEIRENASEPLTGDFFQFTHRELLYMFAAIEYKYKLQLDPNKFKPYEFNTINGIVEIIGRQQ